MQVADGFAWKSFWKDLVIVGVYRAPVVNRVKYRCDRLQVWVSYLYPYFFVGA